VCEVRVCAVVCFACSGDGSTLRSEDDGGLLETMESGLRMKFPGEEDLVSSQGSKCDLLWSGVLS
jgi:hypothetical protein